LSDDMLSIVVKYDMPVAALEIVDEASSAQ
jgi:hypothetical protein